MTQDVTQAVEVEAPPDRVWELLTDPAELPRWWPDAAELEPRVGGRVVLRFGPGDVSGEITTWEPPSALGFTWEASNMPGVRLHVALTVDDMGDGRSRVSVVHSGFEAAPAEAREAVVGGWAHFLPRLAEVAREESR
ncbi:MAG TPA: SRPBCC domain-containing protein [Gaiellaceae bacterium]|nr:SRPBCC domain-containing protein [Gaiellaceae bacterium]